MQGGERGLRACTFLSNLSWHCPDATSRLDLDTTNNTNYIKMPKVATIRGSRANSRLRERCAAGGREIGGGRGRAGGKGGGRRMGLTTGWQEPQEGKERRRRRQARARLQGGWPGLVHCRRGGGGGSGADEQSTPRLSRCSVTGDWRPSARTARRVLARSVARCARRWVATVSTAVAVDGVGAGVAKLEVATEGGRAGHGPCAGACYLGSLAL